MDHEGSLSCSQEPTIGPHSELDSYSSQIYTKFN